MDADLKQERRQAHELLDLLPAEKLAAVRSLLQVMVEPLSQSLASAPVDDEEEVTPETAAAIERARASLARGEGIPHEKILREFGLGK
jgi:ethanolamine utilization microcompartment shell protein EutL